MVHRESRWGGMNILMIQQVLPGGRGVHSMNCGKAH